MSIFEESQFYEKQQLQRSHWRIHDFEIEKQRNDKYLQKKQNTLKQMQQQRKNKRLSLLKQHRVSKLLRSNNLVDKENEKFEDIKIELNDNYNASDSFKFLQDMNQLSMMSQLAELAIAPSSSGQYSWPVVQLPRQTLNLVDSELAKLSKLANFSFDQNVSSTLIQTLQNLTKSAQNSIQSCYKIIYWKPSVFDTIWKNVLDQQVKIDQQMQSALVKFVYAVLCGGEQNQDGTVKSKIYWELTEYERISSGILTWLCYCLREFTFPEEGTLVQQDQIHLTNLTNCFNIMSKPRSIYLHCSEKYKKRQLRRFATSQVIDFINQFDLHQKLLSVLQRASVENPSLLASTWSLVGFLSSEWPSPGDSQEYELKNYEQLNQSLFNCISDYLGAFQNEITGENVEMEAHLEAVKQCLFTLSNLLADSGEFVREALRKPQNDERSMVDGDSGLDCSIIDLIVRQDGGLYWRLKHLEEICENDMNDNDCYDKVKEKIDQIKQEILFCIGNPVIGTEDLPQLERLNILKQVLINGGLAILSDILQCSNSKSQIICETKTTKVALESISEYFSLFKEAAKISSNSYLNIEVFEQHGESLNELLVLFENEHGGVQNLENCQYHENECIYTMAHNILCTYYTVEYENENDSAAEFLEKLLDE